MGSRKQALREMGIDAIEVSGSTMMRMPSDRLFCPKEDDPEFGWAHDPRSLEDPDVEMVESMIARHEGRAPNVNERPIVVLGDPVMVRGEARFLVHDGNRRTAAADAASKALRRRGLLAKGESASVLVEFRWFKGADGELDRGLFIAERVRANRDPTRKPDTASVLAYRVAQLIQHRKDRAEIGEILGVSSGVVEALEGWNNWASKDLREATDAGRVPLELLPALVGVSKADQVAHAAKLQAEGVRTSKGATRRKNKARSEKDPFVRPLGRRAIRVVGKALQAGAKQGDYYAEGVADALLLVTLKGADAQKHLDSMPRKVAEKIRAALAPKGGEK